MSARAAADGPLVAVVVPVYNGAEFVEEALESVVAQTYPHWDCAVIDNRSTDGTAEIVERVAATDPRVRLVRATEHVGIYANHNRALAAAPAEARYVKVLHADDWMSADCLERMVSVAERHPSVGVVGGWRLFGDERDLDSLPTDREVFDGRTVVRQSLTGGPYVTGSPSSLLLRTTLLEGDRPFYDESIWHSDTEAIYAALLRSDLGYVHEVVTFTRLHPGANTPFSDEVLTYAPENILMLCRLGRAVLPERAYRRQLVKELVGYAWFAAKQLLKPSRHRDPRFRAFHLDAIRRTRREVPGTSPTGLALAAVQALVWLQGGGSRGGPEERRGT
ncbi:MAG TPA: glycosyltransferase family 2 protein [Gaiella sp.]|jgi:glycosyltransferase involved in cell wall biosynthesis|nr:glycosyltransferase family 2 protein [Gaiella sp.]